MTHILTGSDSPWDQTGIRIAFQGCLTPFQQLVFPPPKKKTNKQTNKNVFRTSSSSLYVKTLRSVIKTFLERRDSGKA